MTGQPIDRRRFLRSLGLGAAAIGASRVAPLVLVFVFLQRYLVQGVAETGIKG